MYWGQFKGIIKWQLFGYWGFLHFLQHTFGVALVWGLLLSKNFFFNYMCTCSKGEKSSKVEWQNISSVNTIFTYSLFFVTFPTIDKLCRETDKTVNLRPLSFFKNNCYHYQYLPHIFFYMHCFHIMILFFKSCQIFLKGLDLDKLKTEEK